MALWLKTASGMVPVGGDGAYMTVTPWAALPLNGQWVPFGGGYQNPEYRLVGDNVELRGYLKISSGSAASGTAIATLPVGFRPPSNTFLPRVYTPTSSASVAGEMYILTTGVIQYYSISSTSYTPSGWFSLNDISFSITPVNAVPKYSEVPTINPIGGIWRRTGALSIANTTYVTIPYDTEVVDTDGFLTTPSGTITIPAGLGGIYAITCSFGLGAVGLLNIIPPGALHILSGTPDVATGWVTASGTIRLNAGESFTTRVWIPSGGPLNPVNSGYLEMWKVA